MIEGMTTSIGLKRDNLDQEVDLMILKDIKEKEEDQAVREKEEKGVIQEKKIRWSRREKGVMKSLTREEDKALKEEKRVQKEKN